MREQLWRQGKIISEKGDAYTLEYYLLVDEAPCGPDMLCENYGIRLKISGEEVKDEKAVRGITTSAKRIEEILELFSSNEVTPVSLRDVLDDYMAVV